MIENNCQCFQRSHSHAVQFLYVLFLYFFFIFSFMKSVRKKCMKHDYGQHCIAKKKKRKLLFSLKYSLLWYRLRRAWSYTQPWSIFVPVINIHVNTVVKIPQAISSPKFLRSFYANRKTLRLFFKISKPVSLLENSFVI